MKTTARISKWGNGVGLRLPKKTLEDLGIDVGSILNVDYSKDVITLKPQKQTLTSLVSQINKANEHDSVDWGADVGAENVTYE